MTQTSKNRSKSINRYMIVGITLIAVISAVALAIGAPSLKIKSTPYHLWANNVGYNVYPSGDSVKISRAKTTMPVVHYFGLNANGKYMAYLPKVDNFPGTYLVLEKTNSHSVKKIDIFMDEAIWSPTNPNLLAYGGQSGEDGRSVLVYNVKTKESHEITDSNQFARKFYWSPDGSFIRLESVVAGMRYVDRENGAIYQSIDVSVDEQGERSNNADVFHTDQQPLLTLKQPKNIRNIRRTINELGMEVEFVKAEGQDGVINFPDGTTITQGFGNQKNYPSLTIDNSQLNLRKQIDIRDYDYDSLQVLPRGVLMQGSGTASRDVIFISVNGDIQYLELPNQISESIRPQTVNYMLPMPDLSYGYDLTVVQVGQGWPTACNLFDHFLSNGLGYAYDIQSRISSGAPIVASADGNLMALNGSVSCNYGDADCPGAKCSSASFGNYVVLLHADGSYTRYAHLAYGSIPTFHYSNQPVHRGCQIGVEGHTGFTAGNKNLCGDHLHFQWQSTLFGSSIGGYSFAEAPGSLSCTTYWSSNAGSSCIF